MIYASATDHINNHPYMVTVPPYIQKLPTPVLRREIISPIYEAFDDKLPQRSMITIAKMVELYTTKTPFTILEDYDVLLILHQIDAYVSEVCGIVREHHDVQIYVQKILRFRDRIYKLFLRVLNHHPQWKSVYNHKKNIFDTISELYKSLGLSVDTSLSLIEELSISPAVREYPDRFATQLNRNIPSDGRVGYSV